MSLFNPRTPDPQEAIRHRMQFYASRGRPCMPDVSTLQFLKSRVIPGYQMHDVMVLDEKGEQWYFTYFLYQLFDGTWHISSGSGGRRNEYHISHDAWVPLRSHFGEQEFYAGGEVIDHGCDIVRVRLISPDGQVFEDIVEDGLVLFWSHQKVRFPLLAECYNRDDEIVHQEYVLAIPRKLLETDIGSHFRSFVQDE